MRKYFLRFIVLFAPFVLAGCGDGWEMRRVDNVAPYGNSRTAGSSIVYVRVKMLPKKELKLETTMEQRIADITEEEQISNVESALDAEEIFSEAQVKGGSFSGENAADFSDNNLLNSGDNSLEISAETTIDEDIALEKASVTEQRDNIEEGVATAVSDEVEIPNVDEAAQVQPGAGDVDDVVEDSIGMSETEALSETNVEQPVKEIITPRRDYFNFTSEGQESLDDIYNDPMDSE